MWQGEFRPRHSMSKQEERPKFNSQIPCERKTLDSDSVWTVKIVIGTLPPKFRTESGNRYKIASPFATGVPRANPHHFNSARHTSLVLLLPSGTK